jgi:hypothetical protein
MSHQLQTYQSSRARATGGALRVTDESEREKKFYFKCPKCPREWESEKKARFCCSIKVERY